MLEVPPALLAEWWWRLTMCVTTPPAIPLDAVKRNPQKITDKIKASGTPIL